MKFLKECFISLLELLDTLTLRPFAENSSPQLVFHQPQYDVLPKGRGPKFSPPGKAEDREEEIQCDYPAMRGWTNCSTPENRGCWLRNPDGREYSLTTNYEEYYPEGKVRKYHLRVDNMTINADGVENRFGKVFNDTYPGPWIQACWGDILEITVENNLPYNGTTIHWHGLRQLESMEMDGVNGVTQCPIAPGHNFTYRFRARQYGTSWYHSHYSLQYGDGLVGPLTIHGPSSAKYDLPKNPILISDWNHRSAFQDYQGELTGDIPKMTSILLNGLGSYAGGAKGGLKYKTVFEHGKRYLLRIINTSVDTTFIFAIDRHNITVMSSDFVPIHIYSTDHIVVGIGQRYHVVVDATPLDKYHQKPDQNLRGQYWIRTIPATGCAKFELGGIPDERQGIIYYGNDTGKFPTTARKDISLACRDEPWDKLRPILPWTVEKPEKFDESKELFEVGTQDPEPNHGRPLPNDTFSRWSIGNQPLWLNFSDPTILNLDKKAWKDEYVVVEEKYPENGWIYLIITSSGEYLNPNKHPISAAHPIHLHGHDFALLQQSNETWKGVSDKSFHPQYDNPPRRDVVLLPGGGFIVIAFKADNPGAWLLHCHIAWHASSGLALQILERQKAAAQAMTPARLAQSEQLCSDWNHWYSNSSNYYNATLGKEHFQDDSGI